MVLGQRAGRHAEQCRLAAFLFGGQQRRVVAKDRGLQISKCRTGVDAEFLGESLAHRRGDRERFGLPPRPVQRQHQLAMQPFAERMGENQSLEFGNHGMLLAQGEIGVNPVVQRNQSKFLQPRCLGTRKLGRAQVVEHRSPPQAERLTEHSGRVLSVTEPQRLLATFQQTLELGGVDLVGVDEQPVAGLPGNQRIPRPHAGQPAPEMRHMGTQRDIRACGWRTAPQCIRDPSRCNAPIEVDQQEGKQLALLVPAKL